MSKLQKKAETSSRWGAANAQNTIVCVAMYIVDAVTVCFLLSTIFDPYSTIISIAIMQMAMSAVYTKVLYNSVEMRFRFDVKEAALVFSEIFLMLCNKHFQIYFVLKVMSLAYMCYHLYATWKTLELVQLMIVIRQKEPACK